MDMQDAALMLMEQLNEMPPAQRRNAKAELVVQYALAEQAKGGKDGWNWYDAKGRHIVVEKIALGVLVDDRNDIVRPAKDGETATMWYKVSVDGKYPNGDGWYGVTNPPTMIADGTKREVTDELTGKKLMVDNMILDPLAAARADIEGML